MRCRVPGCGRPAPYRTLQLCLKHYAQHRRGITPTQTEYGKGCITKQGYRRLWIAGRRIMEHRYVMEKALGRGLLDHETVHHKNGNRLDNRLGNLELWSSSHPCGQRVEDVVAHAVEMLRLYAPDRLFDGS